MSNDAEREPDYETLFDDAAKEVHTLKPEAQAICFGRGHGLYYDGKDWRYADTAELFDDLRPCKRCGNRPTPEGFDACLGYIPGAKSACCGHGLEAPYVMYLQSIAQPDAKE